MIRMVGDERYRYEFCWKCGPGDDRALWVMLNPSHGTATDPDQTMRVCRSFTRSWGLAEFWILNLFAYRSHRPTDLRRVKCDAEGPHNEATFHRVLSTLRFERVIAAWGGYGRFRDQDVRVCGWLQQWCPTPLLCLDTTNAGDPVHPLRQALARPPRPFTPRKLA